MVLGNLFFAIFPQGPTQPVPTRIPVLTGKVDAYPTEEHRIEVTTTTYPVESGASLTDNAFKQPERLKLTGWVSDLLPASDAVANIRLDDRSRSAWALIIDLMEDRLPVTVVTHLRTYRDMLITKAVAPVDVRTGRSLRFTLDLQEVLFARTRIVRLPPAAVSGPAQERIGIVDGGERAAASKLLQESELDRAYVEYVGNPVLLPSERRRAISVPASSIPGG